MKYRLYTVVFLILCLSFSFAKDGNKDMSQKPVSFNNPEVIFGPQLTNSSGVLNESFEDATFPPPGWTKVSLDGGTGWTKIAAGTSPLPGWTGGTATQATPTAGTGMAYATWTTGGSSSNDQWLISPQVTNVQPNDSLCFWLRKFSNEYADTVEVLISTGTSATGDFTILVQRIGFAVTDTGWARYCYRLGDFVSAGSNIYIAWREKVSDNFNDGAAIFLDLVEVSEFVIPVELTSFAANVIDGNVLLNWSTASETNNKGFEVQKKIKGNEFLTIAFVDGKGTTTEAQKYSFTDKNVIAGSYTYRLKQVDYDGQFEHSDEVQVDIKAPSVFSLEQNYPNPFNPTTNIKFSLASDSKVSIKIYNIVGQLVSELINGNIAAGVHNVKFDATGLNSGVYFYKITASGAEGSNFTSVKKMILTK